MATKAKTKSNNKVAKLTKSQNDASNTSAKQASVSNIKTEPKDTQKIKSNTSVTTKVVAEPKKNELKDQKKEQENKVKSQTNKKNALVVKKPKQKVNKKDTKTNREKQIEKYKDVPLGELYQDLNEMKSYVDILTQRRDELLRAKSVVDPQRRKEAIQKTLDDTFMVQFKYQDATFRNHFQPSGLMVVGTSKNNEAAPSHDFGPRVIHRSHERPIYDNIEQPNISHIQITQREPSQLYRVHNGMENRGINTPYASPIPNQPGYIQDQRQLQQMGMQDRGAPVQQQAPNMMQMQQPPMLQQQMLQQQTTTTTTTQTIEQDNGIQPIRIIEKPIIISQVRKLDVWPLYEKIQYILNNRKHSKILMTLIIIFSILTIFGVVFIILWGFAVDWSNWDMDIGKAFTDFYKPMF